MTTWKEFEKECLGYLIDTYGSERVSFSATGGSDSNAPDIIVSVDGASKFNIEVKSPSAQSGQFVVLQENGKFIFSANNKSQSEDAMPFIKYMNDNFDKFKDVGTAGVEVNLPEEEFLFWIINHYKNKNEQFVITKNSGNFIIFPIAKYGDYFETTCSYRVKRSGSGDVPAKQLPCIIEHFKHLDDNVVISTVGKKVYVDTAYSMDKRCRFAVGQNRYMVSDIVGGKYYIRKLSNTANANIIFAIKLKQDQQQADLDKFVEVLSK